jgi:integrase
MIEAGWSRKLINSRINRVRRFVKWAVSEELAPCGAYEALRSVPGLQFGRTAARETEPIRPAPDAWIDPVLPFLSPQVRAMIQVQRLTGMRSAEVVIMRSCDVDVNGEIWFYEPETHKNQGRGHRRIVPIGPRAQQIIRPFLTLSTTAYLFNPIDAERERNAQLSFDRTNSVRFAAQGHVSRRTRGKWHFGHVHQGRAGSGAVHVLVRAHRRRGSAS